MQLKRYNSDCRHQVVELFARVFFDSEGDEEGKLIGHLVSDLITTTDSNDLIGFIASSNETIIGSIFFSRLFLPDNQFAFILSPVAVATDQQGRGVGQQLIRFGLDYLRSVDVELVFTYGDPDFYSKVGFVQISEDMVQAPLKLSLPEGWLIQSLNDKPIAPIKGVTRCVDALNDQRYW